MTTNNSIHVRIVSGPGDTKDCFEKSIDKSESLTGLIGNLKETMKLVNDHMTTLVQNDAKNNVTNKKKECKDEDSNTEEEEEDDEEDSQNDNKRQKLDKIS